MHKTLLACICLSFLLAGCVLQSRTPVFSESDAGTLPITLGTRFIMENHDKAGWTKEEGNFTLQPEGKHYVASDGEKKSDVEALFVPLGNNWWVVQAAAVGDPDSYMLAEWADGELCRNPYSGTSPNLAGKERLDKFSRTVRVFSARCRHYNRPARAQWRHH